VVRRRLSSHGGRADEQVYDSVRHGVGSNISDVSEELAKARSKMLRTTRAMKSMEQELQVLQASIGTAQCFMILVVWSITSPILSDSVYSVTHSNDHPFSFFFFVPRREQSV
jgi:hypothetical protein